MTLAVLESKKILLDKVEEIQRLKGMTANEMAKFLKLSPSYYSMVMKGRRPARGMFLEHLLVYCPELMLPIILHMNEMGKAE